MFRLRKYIIPILLVALLLITSCAQEPPSRFEQAQKESTQGSQRNQTISKDAVTGGSLNKFFPSSNGNYQVAYSQEKKGFAQAKLKMDGKEVAALSISDTISNPSAADKFQQSTEKINGFPTIEQGNTGTAVLVDDRFLVKVLSRDPAFGQSDRQQWLSKFDLKGLAQLQ